MQYVIAGKRAYLNTSELDLRVDEKQLAGLQILQQIAFFERKLQVNVIHWQLQMSPADTGKVLGIWMDLDRHPPWSIDP